jgi:hypothetical protein
LSFKEYLEDYDAKEEESLRRYLANFADGHIPNNPIYPPKDRFPGAKLPFAQPKLCSIWGVIPFHGSAMLSLPCVDTAERFDFVLEDSGVSAKTIPDTMQFAHDTGRLTFGLTGHATLYRHLDFLEPVFREFRPPRGLALPLSEIVGRTVWRGEYAAFMDLASHGFAQTLQEILQASGGADPDHFEANLNNFAAEYVFLRQCGYANLAAAIESNIVSDPARAFQLLVALDSVLVEPSLNATGGPIVLGDVLITAIRAFPEARVADPGPSGPSLETYDVGRFVLGKLVAYPETMEGCLRAIDQYDAAGLERVRAAFYKALEEEDLDSFSASSAEVASVCDQAWDHADRFGWIEKAGGLVPMMTVGVIGALATGNPAIGGFSAIGGGVADRMLGDRSGDAIKRGAGALLRKSHLVTIYDFKVSTKGKERI